MMDTQQQLQQLNQGIAEIQTNLDETDSPQMKERLEAILSRRNSTKRELESKLSVQLNEQAIADANVNDESMLHKHLRRCAMSDKEKSVYIRQHGMPSYLKLKL